MPKRFYETTLVDADGTEAHILSIPEAVDDEEGVAGWLDGLPVMTFTRVQSAVDLSRAMPGLVYGRGWDPEARLEDSDDRDFLDDLLYAPLVLTEHSAPLGVALATLIAGAEATLVSSTHQSPLLVAVVEGHVILAWFLRPLAKAASEELAEHIRLIVREQLQRRRSRGHRARRTS